MSPVLGLTYPQLRPRIVRALNPNGEVKVTVIERLIEAVNILRTEGLAGIWRKILEYVENLQTKVIDGIKDWVVRAVIQVGIAKLAAWSNPVGALIDILLTIYNLIVFFVERFQEILDFASSIFDSIGKIARGQLDDAAAAVESSLAKTIPIMISFLARLLRLPDVGGSIRRVITQLQSRVHAAFDRILNWVVKKIKKLIAKLISKFRRSNPSDEKTFRMENENHKMWVDDTQPRIDIKMASEDEQSVTPALADQSKEEMEQSDDAEDNEGLTAVDQSAQALQQLQTELDEVNRKPQAQRGAPDNRNKLETKIEAATQEIAESAQRSPVAAVVDERAQDREPDEGEGATDRSNLPFRRVIKTPNQIEGSAGDWQTVTPAYETAKSEAESKPDIYANLHRDHIPEFALLRRISQIALPKRFRAGDDEGAPEYLFENLHQNLPAPETDKKPQNPALPVVVIRAAVNEAAGRSSGGESGNVSALLSGWSTHFQEQQQDGTQVQACKAFDEAENAAQLKEAETQVTDDYGAPKVIADMQSHIDDVVRLYQPVETAGAIRAGFATEHLNGAAKNAVSTITTNIFGSAGAQLAKINSPSVAGGEGSLNIPFEQELLDGELRFDSYNSLESSYPVGSYMHRHHLVEENISDKFQQESNKGGLSERMDVNGIVDTLVSNAQADLTPEQRQQLDSDRTLRGKVTRARTALREGIEGQSARSEFSTSLNPHGDGMAINVLRSVNLEVRTQPDSALYSGFESLNTAFAAQYRDAMPRNLADAAGAAFRVIASGESFSSADLRRQVTDLVSASSADMARFVDERERRLFDTLCGTAYDNWRTAQTTANQEIEEKDKCGQPILDRFQALNKSTVVGDNVRTWFS